MPHCVNQWGFTRLAGLPDIPLGYCNMPSGLAVVAEGIKTVFSWTAPHDVLRFDLEYRKVGDPDWITVPVYGVNYSTTLESESTYEWRVTSVCAEDRKSVPAPGSNFTTGVYSDTCVAPSSGNVSILQTSGGVKISWTGITALSYVVEIRKVGSSIVSSHPTQLPEITLYLQPNTLYEVRIKSICTGRESSWSQWIEFNSGAMGYCPNIIGISAVTSSGGAILQWGKPQGVLSVNIKLDGSTVVTGFTGTSYTFSQLNPSTIYTVEIIANCANGSADPLPYQFKTRPPGCNPPGNLELLVNQEDQITATWVPGPGISSQEISLNNGTPVVLGPLVSTYIFTVRDTGRTHTVSVRSICPTSTSTYLYRTIFMDKACLTPLGLAVREKTGKTVTFEWQPVSWVDTYQIDLHRQSDNSLVQTIETSDLFAKFENLQPNTGYYAHIRSVCGADTTDVSPNVLFSTDPLPECEGFQTPVITFLSPTEIEILFLTVSGGIKFGNFLVTALLQPGNTEVARLETERTGGFRLSGLTPGGEHLISVQNLGDADCTGSFITTTITMPGECNVPTVPAASFTSESNLQVTFTQVVGVNLYAILINDPNSGETTEHKVAGSPANITLAKGQYVIQMQSICNEEEDIRSPLIPVSIACPAPENVSATYNAGIILVNWRKLPNVDVVINISSPVNGTTLPVQISDPPYTFKNALPNTVYEVTVYNKCGQTLSAASGPYPVNTGNFILDDVTPPGSVPNDLPDSPTGFPEEEQPVVFEAFEVEMDPALLDCVPDAPCPPGWKPKETCTGQSNCGCSNCCGGSSGELAIEAGSNIYLEKVGNITRVHSLTPTVGMLRYKHSGAEISTIPMIGIAAMGIIAVFKVPNVISFILTGTPAVDQVLVDREAEELVFGTPVQDGEEIQVLIRGIIGANVITGSLPPHVADNLVFGEVPAEAANGVNTVFYTAFPFALNKISVYVNGLSQISPSDYTVIGNRAVVFGTPPPDGSTIEFDYQKASL